VHRRSVTGAPVVSARHNALVSHVTPSSSPAGPTHVWIEQDGSWVPAALEDAVARRRSGASVPVWARFSDPAHFQAVAEQLGVLSDAVRRAGDRGPGGGPGHPHFERLPDGGLFLSSPTLNYLDQTQDVHTGALTIVLVDEVILTVEQGDAGTQDAAAERLQAPELPPEPGARQVLAVLLRTLVGSASEVEVALGEAVADTERAVFSPGAVDPVERIYRLKREIAEARRALVPFSAELPDLVADDEDARGSGQARPWLHRLENAADRLDRRLEGHDRLLGDLLSAYLSQVSVRQNEDIRKISAWAAIAVLPTMVASVYGMNFEHMPELTWTHGYPAVIAAMVGSCIVLYGVFKRSGWL